MEKQEHLGVLLNYIAREAGIWRYPHTLPKTGASALMNSWITNTPAVTTLCLQAIAGPYIFVKA
jgi:hypothetical protein